VSGPGNKFEQYWIPSEKYLLTHRLITFFDEWLFYVALGALFFTENYLAMGIVGMVGGFFVLHSYRIQWAMERKRFDGPHYKRD